MEKDNLMQQIETLSKQGYQIISSDSDRIVLTSRGFSYLFSDLMREACPICEEYLRDNPTENSVGCFHSKEDVEDVEIARKFAKTLNSLEKLSLDKLGFIFE